MRPVADIWRGAIPASRADQSEEKGKSDHYWDKKFHDPITQNLIANGVHWLEWAPPQSGCYCSLCVYQQWWLRRNGAKWKDAVRSFHDWSDSKETVLATTCCFRLDRVSPGNNIRKTRTKLIHRFTDLLIHRFNVLQDLTAGSNLDYQIWSHALYLWITACPP